MERLRKLIRNEFQYAETALAELARSRDDLVRLDTKRATLANEVEQLKGEAAGAKLLHDKERLDIIANAEASLAALNPGRVQKLEHDLGEAQATASLFRLRADRVCSENERLLLALDEQRKRERALVTVITKDAGELEYLRRPTFVATAPRD